jgi:(1->4)-alpha-D-glucan 1-alpha-D-glucosylmutase
MPGVPDLYQGSERFEGSLVDPDNRRPVDFAALAAALSSLTSATRSQSPEQEKLWLSTRVLRARRDRPELFTSYGPLHVTGPAARHVVAFDRGGALTVATRLPVGLAARGGWSSTALVLPEGKFRDALTDACSTGSVEVGEVLGDLPVALLLREPAA